MLHFKQILVGFILLSLSITVYGDEQPRLPHLQSDAVILAYGDSITYGIGAARESNYPAILQTLSRRHVVNLGIPGEITAEGLKRLQESLDDYSPKLLILCLGANDMLRRINTDVIERNLAAMVEISRAHGVPVLLIGVPRPALLGLKTAPFYYDLANRLRIPFEADILTQVLSDSNLKSDALHPNAEGYRLIADAIYDKLKKTGAL